MEIISNYLESMFKGLPQSDEIMRIKRDLFLDMEAKYQELRQNGKTENEAIGSVISEFGNIDELVNELGITPEPEEISHQPVLSLEKVREYLNATKFSALLIAGGVSIILFGVAITIFLNSGAIPITPFQTINKISSRISSAALLFYVIPAVAMFIYSGSITEKYRFIKEGGFSLDRKTKSIVEAEASAFAPKQTMFTICGITLILLAAIVIIIFSDLDSDASVSAAMVPIAMGVAGFIFSGSVSDGYKTLLKKVEFQKENDKIKSSIASIVFPLVTVVYLIWGFVYDGWNISWIIFPIAGILYGVFCSIYDIFKGSNH